jgi:hypothetical protein
MEDGSGPISPGGRGSGLLNTLTLILLSLTIIMLLYFVIILAAPTLPLNPLPPIALLDTPTPPGSPTPTLPPTWTSTPEQIYSPTPRRPTATPTATSTARPTRTPIPTDTPTPSVTPTPTVNVCDTLKLLGPPPGQKYFQYDIVTLTWTFGRTLGPDEHFDVLLDPPAGSMGSIGWADESNPKNKDCGAFCEYDLGTYGVYPGGRFNWTIAVIRTDKDRKVVAQVCKPPDPYFFLH